MGQLGLGVVSKCDPHGFLGGRVGGSPRMALLISARINDFHAKSVFVIRSYVIACETIWLAMLNLLIRCISPSHIIINVVNSNDKLAKLWQLLLFKRIQYCLRHLKLIFLLSELIRAITQMASFCISRIHYPLPLPYVGKPDPVQLQETIRKLREENQHLKEQVKLWLCTSLQTILLFTVITRISSLPGIFN